MSEVSREYYGSYSVDDEDQLQFSDTLDGRGVSDLLDEGYSPPEKWSAGEGFGTTAAEALRGETFEQRLAQEEPDIDPYAVPLEDVHGPEIGRNRAGRLVAPDEGSHFDLEEELVAADVGIDGGAASAEEAAILVVDDEPLELDEIDS
jgi:hypothetical protein